MSMTSDAKAKLSKTIRSLRERLLTELGEATDREYRMSVRSKDANLNVARTAKRQRLEDWMAEQVRASSKKGSGTFDAKHPEGRSGQTSPTPFSQRKKDDFRRDAEKQAAYTLLNRLVILRTMEATGLRKPMVVTGGWNSRGYKDFRELAPALVRNDDSEGYSFLLQLIFEDLATDLPGLYGSAGIADLIPVPSATIRAIVEAFDDPELESCWTDDMTLGWVYQYWNDPEREALDAKINNGGKIEPHEIASKTQMFTERYMVDWLLQNSLGPMWLAMCKKHGWTPDVEADGTLERLEQRRIEWRAKRDAGEVELAELMPLETDAEHRWAYYVPQPIPDDAVENAPDSVRDLKILDPAVGSGHFLVVAFDLLVALYKEEARHRGEGRESFSDQPAGISSTVSTEKDSRPFAWTDTSIVERILEHNLHGIDLDPRAVQIAAAALWLKAQQVCRFGISQTMHSADAGFGAAGRGRSDASNPPKVARPKQLNLVASNLGIASLPDNDPALVELRQAVQDETGIPAKLTNQIIEALRGADHLGSLLKVDAAIEAAIAQHEQAVGWKGKVTQIDMFPDGTTESRPRPISREWAATGMLAALETFLDKHTSAQELGLRLHGEQLAAGVRFVRLVREDTYDLVVANPPYQGTSKMASKKYVETEYKLGKADLFAAFLLRGLHLVRPHGVSAMLTMRNWMFIKQYSKLREHLLKEYDLRALGDFDRGAFEDIPDEVVSVCVVVFSQSHAGPNAVAQCPTPREDTSRDNERTQRKRAATLCHFGRHEFAPAALKVVPEWPLVYWWPQRILTAYEQQPLVGEVSPAREGITTGDNTRFRRFRWESFNNAKHAAWVPLVAGAAGKRWREPLDECVNWHWHGIEMALLDAATLRNMDYQLNRGVAFTTIGATFGARAYQFPAVFEATGRSVHSSDLAATVCALNTSDAQHILKSLNPTIHFTVGDVNRLPFLAVPEAKRIFDFVSRSFNVHESHREPSVEFLQTGPSPWRYAQTWAQRAVDRAEGEPLPEYLEELDPEPPTDHVSFAVGIALGRFGPNGEGILDPATGEPTDVGRNKADELPEQRKPSEWPNQTGDANSVLDQAAAPASNGFARSGLPLPHGILFLDGTLSEDDRRDSLGHSAAQIVHDKWNEFAAAIDTRRSLSEWLRDKFFKDVHRQMYENRPIHWPLSSAKRTFVAWVNIHRWSDQTLRVLLADHLQPTLTRLDGEIEDLTVARGSSDKKAARDAESRYDDVKAWRDELVEFMTAVEQCADKGPAPPDPKKLEREVDSRYVPDLDDGVMINSAALWPLLEPQWKDPKKWWKELVAAKGKKDYDWSHLAMRYWPTRVDKKCQTDPSLGVAHGCFWKYHPARAWAWELRLQDEIGPDFRIEEAPYRGDGGDAEHRAAFLKKHASEALDAIEKEVLRRRRKQDQPQANLTLLEAGLWSVIPNECWELELRLSKKQEAEFRLLAPDEPKARTAFEKKHPDKVEVRQNMLSKFKPPDLFAGEDDDR
ncbi:MAG: BREX-6 system adenine-specific DNA-methyltransferase PglX [Fuerstiella sp.]